MRAFLSLQMLFAACVAMSAVSYSDRVQRLREALDRSRLRAGLGEKTAAHLMEMDPAHWTKHRAMGGVLGRLIALPTEFWREFLPALGQIVNVPVTVGTDDDRLEQVVRRAVKAELRCESDKCSAA